MTDQPHVVILGAGFGGLGVVERLRAANVRITLIDKNPYHTFQPLLYQVATNELGPSAVSFPLQELSNQYANLRFIEAAVQKIDLVNRQVLVAGQPPQQYDYLVIALGAVVNYFQTPGAASYALPMYTLNDALRLKAKILSQLEAAHQNPALCDEGALTFCVVGGGPTGVEVAGAIAELLRSDFIKDYPNLPTSRARIMLFEYAPDLLGPFQPALRNYAREELVKRGVDVRTSNGVSQVNAASIVLSTGESIKTQTLIWAAGLQANPLVASLGIPLAHGDRIPIDADLQITGHPNAFALGDIAAMKDAKTGAPLPGLGAVALQAGEYLGESIQRRLANQAVEPFVYCDKGTMATIGHGAAIVELPLGLTLTGLPAWLAWLGVHLSLLHTAEQRNTAIVDWGWNLITGRRGESGLSTDAKTPA
ncbi:NADH dehydrogenase-like protein [Anatilimnocola aggregata]|uniref:NADH dehydrogenase-like protein n=1 Tax=Anatilimnocola aggregata TaxID=2528021 RepID=A0A517YDA6_9BACT|nr:NAD(P)/FAD-dependent oxidoreductase [Anatilimnocola aggregata]QDU28218.1 NADH dehydrogenase-like protein [Anatilimnocola aggregata]